jgi:hypothetical protein
VIESEEGLYFFFYGKEDYFYTTVIITTWLTGSIVSIFFISYSYLYLFSPCIV